MTKLQVEELWSLDKEQFVESGQRTVRRPQACQWVSDVFTPQRVTQLAPYCQTLQQLQLKIKFSTGNFRCTFTTKMPLFTLKSICSKGAVVRLSLPNCLDGGLNDSVDVHGMKIVNNFSKI